jgi:hypothetical protein
VPPPGAKFTTNVMVHVVEGCAALRVLQPILDTAAMLMKTAKNRNAFLIDIAHPPYLEYVCVLCPRKLGQEKCISPKNATDLD